MIRYLFEERVLFRSVYDLEELCDDNVERKYHSNFKLYLSPKGNLLFDLLSSNSLLLEIYNDTPSSIASIVEFGRRDSSLHDKLEQLLDYVERLFSREQELISLAYGNLTAYCENFGNELIVSTLLTGIVKNIDVYYIDRSADYYHLVNKVKLFLTRISSYIDAVYQEFGIRFIISDTLSTCFEDTV